MGADCLARLTSSQSRRVCCLISGCKEPGMTSQWPREHSGAAVSLVFLAAATGAWLVPFDLRGSPSDRGQGRSVRPPLWRRRGAAVGLGFTKAVPPFHLGHRDLDEVVVTTSCKFCGALSLPLDRS